MGFSNPQNSLTSTSEVTHTIEWYALSFVDILGQTAKLTELDNESISSDEVRKIIGQTYGHIKQFRHIFLETFASVSKHSLPDKRLDSNELKSHSFSDFVINYLSLRNDEKLIPLKGIYSLLFSTGGAFLQMLSIGVPVRGAIEIGRCIEHQLNGSYELYGSALSNAYKLEENAGYPRIIIGKRLYEYIFNVSKGIPSSQTDKMNHAYALRCMNMISVDKDGCYVLNYLSKEFPEFPEILMKAYSVIEFQVDNLSHDKKLQDKYLKIKDFFDSNNS